MRSFLKTYVGRHPSKLLTVFLAVFCVQTARSQEDVSLGPVLPMNSEPDWILGPTKADLGGFATIQVPEGYRFVGPLGARILLQRMKNPVPKGLLGLLAPDSGKWWLVLDSSEVGYIQGLNQNAQIDAEMILESIRKRLAYENAMRARQGGQPIADVSWAMLPALDPARFTLEWALSAETRTERVINLQQEIQTNSVVNHTMRLIGKRYLIGLTAVAQSEETSSDSLPLKALTENIAFKPGETYADYKAGDELAKLTLEEIIVGEQVATPLPTYMKVIIWVGSGVAGLLAIGLGAYLLRRKWRRMKMSRAFPGYEEHDHVLAPVFGNGKHRSKNGVRRRRTFNYQKYYSDMMLEVSSGPSVLLPNGVRERKQPAQAAPAQGESPNELIVRANQDLIANQNHLIEEQKRLLQEQSKLIEEKSKLIHEKTRFLQKQSELLERDIL